MRLSESGVDSLAQRAFASFVEEELRKMPLFFELKAVRPSSDNPKCPRGAVDLVAVDLTPHGVGSGSASIESRLILPFQESGGGSRDGGLPGLPGRLFTRLGVGDEVIAGHGHRQGLLGTAAGWVPKRVSERDLEA